jgi:predicted dehydrogenase
MDRRTFLKSAGISIPACYIVPRHVLGGKGYTAPNEKLQIASVGAGGVCTSYIENCSSENIVALCDVDEERAAEAFKTYPGARRYKDFRVMFEKEEKNIDAVIIGTPDHTHTIPAITAMRLKKHVYLAKPLTRTIYESRVLLKVARETGVATQMSTQQNASDDHRLLCEMIWSGVIGDVYEVHTWSNRPIWPQGIERPEESMPVPSTLDWDLWLGPAPKRPYHSAYVPFKFRGWYDFGTGALGDMGCHQFDPIVKALKLEQPTRVQASSSKLYDETFPVASIVHYDFAARSDMPAVKVTWYDGGLQPKKPDELNEDVPFGDWNGGLLMIGHKGKILCDAVGNKPMLLPKKRNDEYAPPPQTLPRSIGHYKEWIEAAKGGEPTGANFEYGCPVTELVLLGNIAVRTQEILEWDYENMKIRNSSKANELLKEEYHNGWDLEKI